MVEARRVQREHEREMRDSDFSTLQRGRRAGHALDHLAFPREVDARDLKEFASYLRGGSPGSLIPSRGIDFEGYERRDLGVGTGSAGGYLVPADFARELIKSMRFYAAMLPVS